MADFGLDPSGFRAPRAADLIPLMRDAVDARLAEQGLPEIDWDNDLVLSILLDVVGVVGLGALAEQQQAIYDAQTVGGARGVHLQDIGAIRGVPPLPPAPSAVVLDLAGEAGTVVPSGKLVGGAGAEWRTTEDVVLPASVVALATEAGRVEAGPGEVDQILTPVAGWTSATNPAAATPGRDEELDPAYRRRMAASLANRGSGTLPAIQGRLLALPFVQGAYVVSNRDAVHRTVQGLEMRPNSVAAAIFPATLTTEEQEQVAELLFRHVDPGTWLNGAVEALVVRDDGYEETVRWTWATELSVDVAVTVVLGPGYALDDVESDIEDAVAGWFAGNARLGRTIDDLDLACEIADLVPGVRRATVLLNGGVAIEPSAAQFPVLSDVQVTL